MKHIKQLKNGLGVTMHKLIPGILLAAAFALSACGGGASNSPNQNPNGGGTGGTGGTNPYNGPAAQNEDTQNFRVEFWENIRSTDRCGNCHDANGSANIDFANNGDVNLSYNIAINYVNPNDTANSRFVTKFQGAGHFCWESTQNACAIQLQLWINNWINGNNGSGRAITLTPPQDENPAPSAVFDTNVHPSYSTGNNGLNIHTLVTTHCSGCHVPNGATLGSPQSPYFAVGTAQASYDVVSAVPLINLSTPALSRFYTRLSNDGHRCWDSPNDAVNGIDCASSAADMLSAINYYINQATAPPDLTELNSMVKSRAVTLFEDGIVASGGSRYEANQIALYEFKTGIGDTVLDVSGVSPSMNLTLTGSPGVDYEWLGSYGIKFNTAAAKAQANSADSSKLYQMISATGEYTIEAWVLPANVSQEDAQIAEYSFSETDRNFMLEQDMYAYRAYNRNDNPAQTNADATPFLATADEDAQSSLQHVVVTYDATNGRRIYVNGTFRDDVDPQAPAAGLSTWNNSAKLILGNSALLSRPWEGSIRLFAVHNRVLTDAQIQQNFDVGVGQKYYLLFDISEHINVCQGPDPDPAVDDPIRNPDHAPLCFIYLEAAQFDNGSYLFAYPRFITLDSSINVTGVRIRGMRIGLNGREASNGQAFAGINATIGQPTAFDPAVGQQLSSIGTIIAIENGPQGATPDQFFLTFEELGDATPPTKDYSESFPSTPDAVTAVERPQISIRSFEQINATMAAMTTINRNTTRINQNDIFDNTGVANDGTYTKVKQGLPSTTDVATFVSANQMAITQLAIEYCNALVDNVDNPNPAPRDAYFPGLVFNGVNSPVINFANQAERDLVINRLLEHTFNYDGTNLGTMPLEANIRPHLNQLMTELNATCSAGAFACTQKIIKSTCAAAVASSAMLLQ